MGRASLPSRCRVEEHPLKLIGVRHWYPPWDIPRDFVYLVAAGGFLLALGNVVADEWGVAEVWYIALPLAAAFLIASVVRLCAASVESETTSLPFELPVRRVVCCGTSGELRRVRAISPLSEPSILARRSQGAAAKVLVWCTLLGGLPALRFAGIPPATASLIWYVVLVLFGLVPLRLQYYRVFPGRIQSLESSVFSTTVRVCEEIRLQHPEIVCEFNKRQLSIHEGSETRVFNLNQLWEPHAFAAAVMSAACFPNAPAEPPSSELVG